MLYFIHYSLSRARDAELIDFFQNAPIAMHWLNSDGTVLWANQTELNVLGYTAEEYIGQPIMNFCPDEKELVLEIFQQLGSGNAIADVPVRFRTKEGKIVHLLIDSNVAYKKDGSFGHTRCFIRDDTARKIRDARVQLLLDENERVSLTCGYIMFCLDFEMVPFNVQSSNNSLFVCLTAEFKDARQLSLPHPPPHHGTPSCTQSYV